MKPAYSFNLNIDKISITANEVSSKYVERCLERLCSFAEDYPSRLHLKAAQRHRLHATLRLDDCSSPLSFHAGARHNGISDYRIDFNPSLVGTNGWHEIADFLSTVTAIGFREMLTIGRITRIDVALDVTGLTLEDVIIRNKSKKKHACYSDSRGDIQTVYLGCRKADHSIVYKKDIDKETFMRIERRLKPSVSVPALFDLTNPFKSIEIVPTATLAAFLPPIPSGLPFFFYDSCRIRGIRRASKELPFSARKAVNAAMKNADYSAIPNLDRIWERWPETLAKQLDLMSLDIDLSGMSELSDMPCIVSSDEGSTSLVPSDDVEKRLELIVCNALDSKS